MCFGTMLRCVVLIQFFMRICEVTKMFNNPMMCKASNNLLNNYESDTFLFLFGGGRVVFIPIITYYLQLYL